MTIEPLRGDATPTTSIRRAGEDDVAGVLAVDHEHGRAGEVAAAVLEGRCLVAEVDGEVAAFSVGGRFFGADFLELLVVRGDVRRTGIGTALVRAWAAGAQSDRLYTSTNASNQPMRALCAALGFVEAGWVDLDEGDPEIVYARSRPDDDAAPASGPLP